MQVNNKLLQKRLELRAKKNADYAREGDPYWNFRLVEEMTDIPAWVGVYIRLLDKVSRIGTFIRNRYVGMKVDDEKVEDTLMDLCNYADIMYELYEIWRRKQKEKS